ncbi:MAG TPA: hypothetical protein VM616_05530 [Gammaproteobacteria bacterium]|nr:hypothetical protein [Gammaproteobacteria bacterium]
MRAESHIPVDFLDVEAATRLEPLPPFVAQRDQGDRHLEQATGEPRDAIE